MFLEQLEVTNFRNYNRANVAFEPGITVIVGKNGQGKTNLVEAIGYLSVFGSHRTFSDDPLIRAGHESAIVRGSFRHETRQLLVEVQINQGSSNLVQIAGKKTRVSDAVGKAVTALFSPEDLVLVKGDPTHRRKFVDQLLRELRPRLSDVFSQYDRVLKQRNSLLKSFRQVRNKADLSATLDIWNRQLVDLGARIMYERAVLIAQLMPHLEKAYRKISDTGEAVSCEFLLSTQGTDQPVTATQVIENREAIADVFEQKIQALEQQELERGITLVGPHRDDLLFSLQNLSVRAHASHGESWSYALSLKLAQAELLRAESVAGDPILILDDVFAELDSGRRTRLAEAIESYEQVLITAAVAEDIPEQLVGKNIGIARGSIVPIGGEQ